VIERRFAKRSDVRAQKGHIDGHAAVFNQEFVLWEDSRERVVEIVKPGAFQRALDEQQDVRALFNHDPNNLLGRTTSGTLELEEDQTGLFFDCAMPKTQIGRSVYAMIDRRDVSGCSFAFTVRKEHTAETKKNGKLVRRREIQDVDLYDVGPVTYPAYVGTDVNARARELRSVMFPEGVPPRLMRIVPGLASDRFVSPGEDPELILLDMDLRLIQAGLKRRS